MFTKSLNFVRCINPFERYITYLFISLLTFFEPQKQNKNLICKISNSTITPLFIYINNEFKSASIVFDDQDEFNPYSSPLIDFRTLHCYSTKGDYIGAIDVDEITFQEIGCVYAIVGKTKTKLPQTPKPLFCLGKLSYQKRFYKNNTISKNGSIYVLNKAIQIIKNFLNENSLKFSQIEPPGFQTQCFKIINILKFDINTDNVPEIFAQVKCNIEENYIIITSFSLSKYEPLYISTTYVTQMENGCAEIWG